ncbi:MAG: flagellar hook assembly protein FlgD [Pseudomonadota bacterium]
MSVTSFSGLTDVATALNGESSANNSANRVADDFDDFLSLLLTQLENQNPLEPLDTNQFTEQLVQFAEVEQQIATNQNLELQMNLSAAMVATSAVNFIGKTVTIETTRAALTDGEARWEYQISGQPTEGQFTVSDEAGNVVFSETLPISNSRGTYTWDGRNADGQIMPDGTYTVTVEANDAVGDKLTATTAATVVIDGVDFLDAEPMLKVDGQLLRLSAVTSVDG